MKVYIEPIGKLVNQFQKMPGVGAKTAQRFAYKVIRMSDDEAKEFAEAILRVKREVKYCAECGNYTTDDVCDICKTRSKKTICVVKEASDIMAIEKLNQYNGVYHVLNGLYSPKDGVGLDDLSINSLIEKIKNNGVTEVILAIGTNVEGDATSVALSYYIKQLGVKVTRLAQGIPIGTDIEYADEGSLSQAFSERKVL